jgi:hypothetical protein
VSEYDYLAPPLDSDDVAVDIDAPVGAVAAFDPEAFERFCARLSIDSKEQGLVPLRLMGGQRYFIEQLTIGLTRGIHTFVVLKGRQLGISTVLLALDIYWMFKHGGMQGAVVTDTDDNRELFRSMIERYIKTLPSNARTQIHRHNRVQLLMRNRSRLMYMVAGEKKKGNLGRAKSANYMHATECSSWGDEEGFGSLVNTLAQKNPDRLYVLESTARGYNMFYQVWEVAKESRTQMAIFIGWWRHEFYSFDEGSVEYQQYWTGELTPDERVWIADIYKIYGVEITTGQISWWRWYVAEQMKGDEMLALQEMPPTEDYAFQLSGSKYFSAERVNAAFEIAKDQPAVHFRYRFGANFEDTEFIPCEADEAEVTVWETPVKKKEATDIEGKYTAGADPAYGSSEWADEHALTILRCYADQAVQAAEVASSEWTDQQFAWVIAHMCGWYGDIMLSLEMQGPGSAVYNELNNLRRRAQLFPRGDPRAGAFDVIGNVRDYLWKKQDTIEGNFTAYQWQTNQREKIRMFSTTRGYWERDALHVFSPRCLQQFKNIHRNGDQIGGEGRAKDDRVIALCIATVAWNDWILHEMLAAGRTFAVDHRSAAEQRIYTPVERSVINYLKQQKIQVPGVN